MRLIVVFNVWSEQSNDNVEENRITVSENVCQQKIFLEMFISRKIKY